MFVAILPIQPERINVAETIEKEIRILFVKKAIVTAAVKSVSIHPRVRTDPAESCPGRAAPWPNLLFGRVRQDRSGPAIAGLPPDPSPKAVGTGGNEADRPSPEGGPPAVVKEIFQTPPPQRERPHISR
jgi:hypothetical protein